MGQRGAAPGRKARFAQGRAARLAGVVAQRLVRARYIDFGPTLACAKLAEQHGIVVSRETLSQWMIDGCEHACFEDRGPKCTLLVSADDATRRAPGS